MVQSTFIPTLCNLVVRNRHIAQATDSQSQLLVGQMFYSRAPKRQPDFWKSFSQRDLKLIRLLNGFLQP